MSSISSLTKAVSGLNAAQKGLQVTTHNITNANTAGYTRQQLLQSDSGYLAIGNNGGFAMQVGLGVTCDEIRQIRDDLADRRLRTESSILNYYQTLNTTLSDIEAAFDEPYGNTISDFINDFWSQAQKLSTSPDGVEERMSFISTAKVMISKVNEVMETLTGTQQKLDTQVEAAVKRVNEITAEIRSYNDKIALAEINGDHANDYRDARNLLLDELSQYGEVSYFEEADKRMQVTFEGHTVVYKGFEIKMEMQDIEGSPYRKPIWSDTNGEVFKMDRLKTDGTGEESGSIKAMLIARGEKVVKGDTSWEEVALNSQLSVDVPGNAYVIPKVQKLLNDFAYDLVNLVNESFTGTGIGEYEGVKGLPVFVPIQVSTEDREALVKLEEDVSFAQKQLIAAGTDETKKKEAQAALDKAQNAYHKKEKEILCAGNVQVNEKLLESGGYNALGTVAAGQPSNTGDNSLVKDFLGAWGTPKKWYGEETVAAPYEKVVTLQGFFSEMVADIGAQGAGYKAKTSEKHAAVTNIENERSAMGGVSTDEEFSNMLKYQYAYSASARMITMLDGMLDTIINKM